MAWSGALRRCERQRPKTSALISCSDKCELVLVVYPTLPLIEYNVTARIVERFDRYQRCMGQVGNDVCAGHTFGQPWYVQVSCMCGLDHVAVGARDFDRVVRGSNVGEFVTCLRHDEMSRCARIADSKIRVSDGHGKAACKGIGG